MWEFRTSSLFEKKLSKLKGQELRNVLKKFDEIISRDSLDFYKNLKYDFKKYKRVHVNNCYVILFFGSNRVVYFVDYEHHDRVYNFNKNNLRKYDSLFFR